MKKILWIQGAIENSDLVEKCFSKPKFEVHKKSADQLSLSLLEDPQYSLVVLDVCNLENLNADLLNQLQSCVTKTPFLVLSDEKKVNSIIDVLKFREYDFVLLPITASELRIRSRALLSKTSDQMEKFYLKSTGLILDLVSRQAYRGDDVINLQNNEFELLKYLMRNAGKVVTKTQILQKIWSYNFDPQTNVVDVLVWRLRSKIDRDQSQKLIQTVRGIGYRLQTI